MSSRPNALSISSAALVTLSWSVTSSLTCNIFGTFRFAAIATSTVALSVAVRSERAPMAMLFGAGFCERDGYRTTDSSGGSADENIFPFEVGLSGVNGWVCFPVNG